MSKILILGASYGSLLATKLSMSGHDATMVCRAATAELINRAGTEVRIKLRDEDAHRSILSNDLPGHIDARTPGEADPSAYDLIVLAMQEPQYRSAEIAALMARIAEAQKPCLSIMNMPPLPYLARLDDIDIDALRSAYNCPEVWDGFEPRLMSLCSPDPQAFRPPGEASNVLHVGLPTNFKAASFGDPDHDALLMQLAMDIEAVRLDGKDVPVKLRIHESPFVPLAKWAMLLTGNYRCITDDVPIAICDAVHSDFLLSRDVYEWVNALVTRLGASPDDLVPFAKYANAAFSLKKPSSAARGIDAGAQEIERVDRLVQALGAALRLGNNEVDRVVSRVDARLMRANQIAAE